MHENENFELPTNIKQIGSISDSGLRVYMEDYVYTYIQQYASSSGCDEKIGILVGLDCVINGQDVIFISGAIQGKFSKQSSGMEVLTEESWEYIDTQMDIYFKGLKIIGWIYVQPGYGEFLNTLHMNYHRENFKSFYQVLFLNDPMEKMSCFFAWDNKTGDLKTLRGYFIYFDRNEGMHEYMLDNRIVKMKEDSNEVVERTKREEVAKTLEVVRKPRTTRNRNKTVAEQKKMINLFGSLSAVLFLVCFIMGAGLIQNDDRITKLEDQLAAIDNSYKYLLAQIKEDNTQSVFAAQSVQTTTEQNNNKEEISAKVIEENGKNISNQQIPVTQKSTEKPTEQSTETIVLTTVAEPTTKKQVNNNQVTGEKQKDNSQKTTLEIPNTYTVKEGDNLSSISRKFYGNGSMMEKIMQENELDDPDKIYFGKVLKLPKP